MELEGSLSVFPLPEVLQFLAQGRMSGTLTLSRGEIAIGMEIRDGKITNSSTMDRPHKLGEMLVHRNLIPRSLLDEALATQRTSPHSRLLGELLIEQGKVTREQLRSAIRLQMEEEIWDLFGWHEGNFKFEQGLMSEDRPAAVEIEIEPLLLEGSRRMDEWKHITKNISEDDAVFTVVPPTRNDEKPFLVKEREWMVLSMINGFFNAGSIIARTGFGTFETYRILNRLLMAGLIQKLPRNSGSSGNGRTKARPATETNPTPSPARQDAGSNTPAGGLKGLLSRKKTQAAESPAPEILWKIPTEVSTPIGLVAAYLNELVAALLANTEFAMGEADRNLLESLWQPVVNICPKADLLHMQDNRLDATVFERFASLGAMEKMQGCYEDSIEALGRLLSRLYKMACQRMGEHNANRVFTFACEALSAPKGMSFDADFSLSAFVAKAIGE